MAGPIWEDGCFDDRRDEDHGRREPVSETDVCGDEHAERSAERSVRKQVLRPSQRKEMAEAAAKRHGVSIAHRYRAFRAG